TRPMTSPSEPRTPDLYHASPAPVFSVKIAAAAVAVSFATFVVAAGGALGAGLDTVGGIACGPAALVATPAAIAWTQRGRVAPRRALGLAAARARYFVAAALVGASAWYLNVAVMRLLPAHQRESSHLDRVIHQPNLVGALLGIALVPAICEE